MDIKKRFAHNLIEQREKAGLSPEELAGLAAIELPQLEAIENGEEQADLETLAKFAGSLRIPVDALFADLTWEPGDGSDMLGPH